MSQIEIYQSPGGSAKIDVRLEDETVWLTQAQMAKLFERDRVAITQHIGNIFREKELDKKLVCKESLHTTPHGAIQGKMQVKSVKHYNLDVIISVGYRVKSKRGTQFRIWATERLKEHLLKGYTLNQKRLHQLSGNLSQLEQAIKVIQSTGNSEDLKLTEAKGLLEIITNYIQSFILLNQFDSNSLRTEKLNENITHEIKYSESVGAISELKKQLVAKKEAGSVFGNQKDNSFKGIIGSIVQTFDGEYLYKSIEEQAAHLLYFVIKNHPFSDGNKRIGAFLFIWFLNKNKHRFKKSGEPKINDTGLTALALLVAQSNPSDKDLMIALIINLVKSR